MTLSFEDSGNTLVMSIDDKVLCRVACDDTDIGNEENLSDFVYRHGGIDATLDYMRRINLRGCGKAALRGLLESGRAICGE